MNGAVETALVIGATSDIGRAIARTLAEDGCALQLAGRDPARLERETRDIRVRTGVAVTAHRCEVLDEDGGVSLLDTLDPLPDVAVCVVGLLGDQAESQRDGAAAERVMRTNYVGPALLMGALAEGFERRGGGVSSVAGERGRAANYVYGSAKAGFTAFLSGLRSRLVASSTRVAAGVAGSARFRPHQIGAGNRKPRTNTPWGLPNQRTPRSFPVVRVNRPAAHEEAPQVRF